MQRWKATQRPTQAVLALAMVGMMMVGGLGGAKDAQACPVQAKVAKKAKADQNARLAWRSDLKGALKEAKATNKPVMVFFATDSCGACDKMVDSTLQDPRVVAELKGFVTVHIDMSKVDKDKVAASFGVDSVPALVFFSPDGKRMESVTVGSFVDADALLPTFAKVKKIG